MRVSALSSALLLTLAISACRDKNDPNSAGPAGSVAGSLTGSPSIDQATYAAALNVNLRGSTRTSTGLYYRDVKVGDGTLAAPGDSVTAGYAGYFPNGRMFDSGSYSFRIGLKPPHVIRGWDEGLVGMKIGGLRQLIIPSDLGYGPMGAPPDIPGNAILVFNIKLEKVQ